MEFYSCFDLTNTVGDYKITSKFFSPVLTRPCKILTLSLRYNSDLNNGNVFSFTIQSLSNPADATARSPPLLVSTFPRSYTLRNPQSTDFTYMNGDDTVSIITTNTSNESAKDDVHTWLLGKLVLVFDRPQPVIYRTTLARGGDVEPSSPSTSFVMM